MALLTLKDIGKIYVSKGNVAVGIRGVNLSFDRGEFVAVTGQSGSGKSTLLNVISGMDTYEEGEMLIEGQVTSHYLQPDWEEYRQKYISFIFQDYNIIESFTVLQNVELALMHIRDKKARRKRALELLDRVGLKDRIRQKGSKLSGGQKQRTVIARALAKDSPIILADEPTGNLDSATSEEIIELLKEVSKDKLLIVVTHNFEQVERYATRHIRIFDGAVESDHVISAPRNAREDASDRPERQPKESAKESKQENSKHTAFRNGVTLGRTIFTAKPKLSVFLCLLLILGTVAIFIVTSFFGGALELFEKHYMFNHIDGRVVVTTRTGAVLTDEEVQRLVADYGAEEALRCDMLLDAGLVYEYLESASTYVEFSCTYGEDYGNNVVGRYPEAENEVLLYLPIYLQPYYGKEQVEIDGIDVFNLEYKITGIKYFYDNNKDAKILFTKDGFDIATGALYLSSMGASLTIDCRNASWSYGDLSYSFDMERDKIYFDAYDFDGNYGDDRKQEDTEGSVVQFNINYTEYDYYTGTEKTVTFSKNYSADVLTETAPTKLNSYGKLSVCVGTSVLREVANELLSSSYRQISLFFSGDKAAHAAAERLRDAGYVAVPSDTTYEPNAFETLAMTFACVWMIVVWLIAILFLALFIHLCSSRTLGAFKNDMAIMRSMGIPVKVVRVGIYVRMLIALIPAFVFLIAAALVVFLTPALNGIFVFLHAWQYFLIVLGMLLLTLRVTHRQIRKLFSQSVKKSLKGGAAE